MSTTNAPSHVIRECDLMLNGEIPKSQEQLNRWLIVQIKKLAQQAAARHKDVAQVRNLAKTAKRGFQC